MLSLASASREFLCISSSRSSLNKAIFLAPDFTIEVTLFKKQIPDLGTVLSILHVLTDLIQQPEEVGTVVPSTP